MFKLTLEKYTFDSDAEDEELAYEEFLEHLSTLDWVDFSITIEEEDDGRN